ncbi:MAG: hypothetical protein AB2L26_05955 [Ignavibacteria bacterium]
MAGTIGHNSALPTREWAGYQNSGFVTDANFFGFGLFDSPKIELTRNGGANWEFASISFLSKYRYFFCRFQGKQTQWDSGFKVNERQCRENDRRRSHLV